MDKIERFIRVPECGLEIDLLRAQVLWNGKNMKMSRQYYAVLVCFARDPWETLKAHEIVEHADLAPSTFWVVVSRLRAMFDQKIIFCLKQQNYTLLRRDL